MSADSPSVASILQQQTGAAQAATPNSQAQPQSPHASGFDNLTCQWQGCGERCASPEQLYEHVCERHVGRKSTNNLNLQCQWGTCRTTTVKRDHITSHIRVHVPLKPHKCEFCGKSFKRPQDLKKHVKTHADDSVLGHANDGMPGGQRAPMPGYQPGAPRVDGGMYGMQPQPQPGYNYPQVSAASASMGNNGGNYAPVYYNIQNAGYAGLALTEQRKRQHDTLDAFFGDIKRRQLDPSQYYDLGAQFGGMQGLGGATDGGYGNGGGFQQGNGFRQQSHDMGAGGGGGGVGAATATMTVPPMQNLDTHFSNLKTRNDLLSIDQFLEQLQKTVYESSNVVAANRDGAGPLVQPTAMMGAVDPDLRNSPPEYSRSQTQSTVDSAGFTPGSGLSGHSPASAHSQPANTGYPTLPSVGTMAHHAMGPMQQQSSGLPPSTLGNAYEDQDRERRYSGSFLQRARPASTGSDKSQSAIKEEEESFEKRLRQAALGSSSPQQPAPPAIMGPPTKSGQEDREASSASDEQLEGWVQNMRTIEMLRKYVHSRLEEGQFQEGTSPPSEGRENEQDHTTPKAGSPETRDYPMDDVKASVAYPTLRST